MMWEHTGREDILALSLTYTHTLTLGALTLRMGG